MINPEVEALPRGWERCRLRHLAASPITNGVGEAADYDDPEDPRYIRITDINGPRTIRNDSFRSLPPDIAARAPVANGDLLLAAVGATFGLSLLVNGLNYSACYAGYLVKFSAGPAIDPSFASYWTESRHYWNQVRSRVIQSTIQNFSAAKFKELVVLVPPLKIQYRIIAFLDEQTAQLDGLIAKKRALLEHLVEKRQAIITTAVTKGLNPAAPMRDSGIDWLGKIPAHWELVPLKRLKRFLTSGSRGWGDFYTDDGDMFLRMTNVTKSGVEINDDDLRFVRLDGVTEGKRTATRTGDILITITAELGSVAIVRDAHSGAFINQHLALFRPDRSQCDPDFLVNFLWSDVTKTQFELSGQGGTKQGLGFDQVDNVMIALPPLDEQKQIVPYVIAARSSFDLVEHLVCQSSERLAEYRSALITSAVTGQLEGLR